MPFSDHLRPRLNHEILGRVLLFLWFRSIGATKSDPNLCANSVNLFLREPLEDGNESLFLSRLQALRALLNVLRKRANSQMKKQCITN